MNSSQTPSCCGLRRPKEVCDEREKLLYRTGMFAADTQYCHHLDCNGRHVVLQDLPLSESRNCSGIMYVSLSFSGKAIKCGSKRDSGGHDPCTKERCPYLRDGYTCPFSA